MANTNSRLADENGWDRTWVDIFDHYQNDIRHAYYIRALRVRREKRLLEIAAGSFRDMAALCKWGISCDGADYSGEAVERAIRQFPHLQNQIHKADAFHLPFDNASYDLTYHNGFWGYYDDAQIDVLAKEQARISRYRMMATVHNAHNVQFREYFDRKKGTDPLYDLRFFRLDEVRAIMSKVCSRVVVVPAGKAKKRGEDRLIRLGLGHPCILRPILYWSRGKCLERSERLICIGEL